MNGLPVPSPELPKERRRRAALARASQRATKTWDAEARSAVAGSLWRVSSVWVEQTSQLLCAEFIHASSGKSRFLKFPPTGGSADRKAVILQQLS